MKNFKNFMDCWDYSTDELLDMASLIIELKKITKKGRCPKLLEGQSLGMIFNGNSTRTRVSFEVASQQLGAHALYLTGGSHGELHLGKRETIGDSAKVISSMVDGIAMRWPDTEEMEEFAAASTVPFFNGMDYSRHPTQTLCDLVTIIENLPKGKTLREITFCFEGQTRVSEADAQDLAKLLPRFGAKVKLVCPDGFFLGGKNDRPKPELIELNRTRRVQACKEGGGSIVETTDIMEAVVGVDYVYTGCVCYEGAESEEDFANYKRDFIDKGYQLNKKLISENPDIKTMHYLPALRGKEMDDYAMDFEGSLLWKQAENRLHTQRGLMAYLMAPLHPDFNEPGRTEEETKIKNIIKVMREKYSTEYTHK